MPTVIREPEVSISLISADTLVGNKPHKILVVGQKTAAGSAVSGALVTNIQNDKSVINAIFGANSQIAGMIRNARLYNTKTRIDAIALDDNGSGVAAVGTFTITGTATVAGSLDFIVGSKEDFNFSIPVAVGDTAAAIAIAAAAAINANASVPATASTPSPGVLTITADNKGTVGNTIGLKVEGSATGISVAVAAMSGGATDPVLTSLFDPIADERYQTIVYPWSANINLVKNFLDARFNVANMVLDGVAMIAIDDTFGNLLSITGALNSQSVCIMGDKKISEADHKGGSVMEIPYAKSAQISGIRALRLTEDAAIGRFVISRSASLDRFGGIALASLPYFNTPVPNLPLPDFADGWTMDEQESLKASGVSVYGSNISGTEVILGEFVTTYKTDPASNDDITFKYLNYVDTSSAVREYFFNNYKATFAQCRLTEGALIPGRAMANPASIEAASSRFYKALADEALVQSGEAAAQFFKQNLRIVIDLANGSASISMVTPIVTQFRQLLATIQIAFSAEG